MTATDPPHPLTTSAFADWYAADSAERTMDAAWLVVPGAEPQQNVRLRFSEGRLVDWSPIPAAEHDQVPPLAVIPPLVNAHTHLEFSTLTKPITPPVPFPDWIRSVIRWRLDNPEISSDGLQAGLHECCEQAVAGIGEITTSDDAVNVLQHANTDVVSFRELIGLLPDRIPEQIDVMQRHLASIADAAGQSDTTPEAVLPGISPHAPYSVHPELLSAAVDTCREQSVPVAMHLAETTDELELLDAGTGLFADFLKELNLWHDDILPRHGTILHYLQQLAKLPRSLAIHCNYLTFKEIRFLADNPQIAVVYCPRTHHYFGHPEHPWREIRTRGGTVVLGTDGRSSNPDLSIWKEVQFLASRYPDATLIELLPLVTMQAAEALGLADRLNSAEQFHASLIQLPADGSRKLNDLLAPQARPVGRLISNGSTVQLESVAA